MLAKSPTLQINICNAQYRTQIMSAVCSGSLKACEGLLSIEGCDPNIPDNEGWTPLTLAVSKSDYRNVRNADNALGHYTFRPNALFLLRSERIDINIRDKSGRTALMIAAAGGQTEIVAALLEFEDCDINATSHDGETALDCAKSGFLGEESVKLLKRRIRYGPLLRQIRRVTHKK